MKLYESKREIKLWSTLKMMFCDDVPGHDFEYMISFDEVLRLVAFGKTWTKNDPKNWGENICKYWIHETYCPTVAYDDIDLFLVDLLHISGMERYFNQKKFHIWEKVK